METTEAVTAVEERDIFISYANEAEPWAKWLRAVFEANGLTCYVSEHSDYDISVTTDKIDAARTFVLIQSKDLKKSDYSSKETEHAFKKKKPRFPVAVSKTPVDQYLYYFPRQKRYELYRKRSVQIKLLIGAIKNTLGKPEDYKKIKIEKYDVNLLCEADVDRILSGEKKGISIDLLSPFSRLYSNHDTVKTALKVYTVPNALIYGMGLMSLVSQNDIEWYIKLMLYAVITAFCLGLWNISYYPSVLIAKLGIRGKAMTVIASIVLAIMIIVFINIVGGIFQQW